MSVTLLKKLKLSAGESRDVYVRAIGSFCAACVFGILGWIIAKQTDWFPVAGEYLSIPVLLPVWLVIIQVAMLSFWAFSLARRPRMPPHERHYRTDTFDNITWIWSYTDHKISNMLPLCVECSTELRSTVHETPRLGYGGAAPTLPGTTFFCTTCNAHFEHVGIFDAWDNARRKIEKKIRDGSWRS